jgi:hypothetical protein
MSKPPSRDPVQVELLALRREIEDLKRQMRQIPSRFPMDRFPYMFVLIDGGNTLDSGQDGVVFVESPGVEEVPSAYDPDVTSTFIDGIGRGTLYINNEAQPGYVLVVNDNRGVNQNAIIEGEAAFTTRSVAIPVDGGGFVYAYVIC